MQTPFAFRKVTTPGFIALEPVKLASPVWEVLAHGHVPAGWVAKVDGQWFGWNPGREMWMGFGTTREKAAEGLYDAPWRMFLRPDPAKAAA